MRHVRFRRPARVTTALIGATVACGLAGAASADETTRVSVDSGGGEASAWSSRPRISAGGRYVVFQSWADDLVPGDSNGVADVFVHDRQTGETTRVSVDSSGAEANADSGNAHLSDDGRFVVFGSEATNLVPGDTNGEDDVFVHDRQTGQTTRVNVSSSGAESQGIAGGFTGWGLSISADGRYVAFDSYVSNLVPGDLNGTWDVFVHDRQTGQTTLESVDSNGVYGNYGSGRPDMSPDGRYIAFESQATNLAPGDTNSAADIYVHDRLTGGTTRASLSSSGAQPNHDCLNPTISDDGRRVVFESLATNLIAGGTPFARRIYVHDRATGETTLASADSAGNPGTGGGDIGGPAISGNGRYVAFTSSNALVPDDTNFARDVYLRDLLGGTTVRVSVDSAGDQANDHCVVFSDVLSADGSCVAFDSAADNLVPGDTNGVRDAFVHERPDPTATAFCSGDGSGTPCPCGNDGASYEGCRNSSGRGGIAAATGTPGVAADDLRVHATHLLPAQPALSFAGETTVAGGAGAPFGDGLRCAGTNVVRLGVQTPDAHGDASWGPGLSALGGWSAGETRFFQVWYRDPAGPCGAGFNLTNGLEVVFAP